MSHTHAKVTQPGRQPVELIRPDGLYHWKEFQDRIPFSRETWRQRMKAGLAPKPRVAGKSCTVWSGADLLAWLNDPAGYSTADDTN